jgi:hypothetical protein
MDLRAFPFDTQQLLVQVRLTTRICNPSSSHLIAAPLALQPYAPQQVHVLSHAEQLAEIDGVPAQHLQTPIVLLLLLCR